MGAKPTMLLLIERGKNKAQETEVTFSRSG